MSETRKRDDVHSTSRILASDYEAVLWYDTGSNDEPSFGVNCERPAFDMASGQVIPGRPHRTDNLCCVTGLRQAAVKFADHGGTGSCTVCGAWFRYGEVWRHVPTGEHIHIGHVCSEKHGLLMGDRNAAVAYQKAMAELRTKAGREKKLATARDEFIAKTDGLAAAFQAKDAEMSALPGCPTHGQVFGEEYCAGCERAKRAAFNTPAAKRNNAIFILGDIYSKLHRYGSISEKQVAFAKKLADQVNAPVAEVVEKPKATAPLGKQTVTGRVISVRDSEGQYGVTYRMTVLVETPAGEWLCNSTIPASIFDALRAQSETGSCDFRQLKGRTVRFTATLEAGNEAHFVFGKRPTKGELV